MALFRCTRSGNTLSLNRQDDIDRIRQQENYTEITHEDKETSTKEALPSENAYEEGQNVLKRRGRGRQKH